MKSSVKTAQIEETLWENTVYHLKVEMLTNVRVA